MSSDWRPEERKDGSGFTNQWRSRGGMGEKVKRKHAQQFRHLQDEAYTELSDPNLFSNRRQLIARAYWCRGRSGDHPSLVGQTTTLMPQDDGRVLVLCGNTHVGDVVEEDCSTL